MKKSMIWGMIAFTLIIVVASIGILIFTNESVGELFKADQITLTQEETALQSFPFEACQVIDTCKDYLEYNLDPIYCGTDPCMVAKEGYKCDLFNDSYGLACIEKKLELPIICVENDSGYDPYNYGVTIGIEGRFEDKCESGAGTGGYGDIPEAMLIEYSCENDKVRKDSVPCSEGCEGGACIPEETIYDCKTQQAWVDKKAFDVALHWSAFESCMDVYYDESDVNTYSICNVQLENYNHQLVLLDQAKTQLEDCLHGPYY